MPGTWAAHFGGGRASPDELLDNPETNSWVLSLTLGLQSKLLLSRAMLRSKTILIYALVLIALASTGCSEVSPNSGKPVLGHYREYAERTLKAAKENNWYTDCDAEDRKTMLMVTAAVDKHAPEIRALLKKKLAEKNDKGENVAGLLVRKSRTPEVTDEWNNHYLSWRLVARAVRFAKTAEDWTEIGSDVDRLLEQDTERMGQGVNYSVDPQTFGAFETAYKTISNCLQSGNCVMPANVIKTITRFWWIRRLVGRIEKKEDAAKNLEQLHLSLKSVATRFHLTPYPSAKRVSQSLIEIPIDPGPLAAGKERLAELLEMKWKSKALSVKVRWTTREKEKDAYLITFDPQRVFAAGIYRQKRIITLSAAVSEGTLTHEFGHVLGFQDHYYTSYEPGAVCAYRFWNKPSDLMSQNTGEVTKAQWEALDRAYPVGGRTWEKDERLPVEAP